MCKKGKKCDGSCDQVCDSYTALIKFLKDHIEADVFGQATLKLDEEYEADILLYKNVQDTFVLSIEDTTLPVYATWFLE